MMDNIKIRYYASPTGELMIGSYDDKICLCDWVESHRRNANDNRIRKLLNAEYEKGDSDVINMAKAQLDEYFYGKRTQFSIPLLFAGTEFQCKVWTELQNIPFGTTISYGELSQRINNPKGVRAVGAAVASNPISIIVPCHRVIAADGQLSGYAGGIYAKQWLLSHECHLSGIFKADEENPD